MFNEIIINKNNLINNIRQVRLNNPNSLLCAMVKANAYGVGLNAVVKMAKEYVDYFGVACLFEAKKVRRLCENKILIVGPLERRKPDTRFSYTCNSLDDVEFLAKYNLPIRVHLKINTGMNRYGIKTLKDLTMCLKILQDSSLLFEGIFTHFSTVDNFVDKQYKKFLKFVKLAKDYGFNPIAHTDNSNTNVCFNHKLDMVRIGFNLYLGSNDGFVPIVSIKSKVAQVHTVNKGERVGYSDRYIAEKKKKVAVIPIGYADGFDMHYIGLNIFCKGKMCEILNICMDCFMLDVSKTDMKKGDDISILDTFNSLKLYADYVNTIEYEVSTKFSNLRARRRII